MKQYLAAALAMMTAISCGNTVKDGDYQIDILTTTDVHGSWFPTSYTDGGMKLSLHSVYTTVKEFRDSLGQDNVILLDAGDCLQGDNAAYYSNYVDTLSPHLFPQIAAYMGYDAIAVGNHDIETGHPVYDKVAADLKKKGIPFLGGNAFSGEKRYFQTYTTLVKNGLKVAVLGYTNPNIRAWLDERLWSGIEFRSLIPLVQEDVDMIRAKEKPQAVIVIVHSGTGKGDGSSLESQGLDLLNSLRGVDFLICGHDHSAVTIDRDSISLINAGSRAGRIGHGRLTLTVKDGNVAGRKIETELLKVNASAADSSMKECFSSSYEKVKEFTVREVGSLDTDLVTRASFAGMCPYMDLIHNVCLSSTGADISFAAPLTFNRTIKAGTLIYNDLFTIYPYENQLFTLNLTGQEIKNYLEYSYDGWIQTPDAGNGNHVLKIRKGADQRTGQENWHFINRSYNFDSAAGLVYTVDVTKPMGERICISGLSGGRAFSCDSTYTVAMTSYRASGGGGLIFQGAGLSPEEADSRITGRYEEMRILLYNWLKDNGEFRMAGFSDPDIIGQWKFVPESAEALIRDDMKLLFGE
ncbi:MAG: bifunctional metallophosphatase/5'-nucleotidase [Candidatus Cryptobacteroides sp.]